MSTIAGVLLGPWCWAVLTAGAILLGAAVMAAGELASRRQRGREWAAEAAERVRTAEYLHWLEDEFTAEETT